MDVVPPETPKRLELLARICEQRMKDFFDLFALCTQFEFEGEFVRQAIVQRLNVARRVSQQHPLALATEFSQDKAKVATVERFFAQDQYEQQRPYAFRDYTRWTDLVATRSA